MLELSVTQCRLKDILMPEHVQPLKSDLTQLWIIQGLLLTTLLISTFFCLSNAEEIKQVLENDPRELIRTIFYVISIITFPITNLIRYIQLRLNQTMPFSDGNTRFIAKKRYQLTVIVSMLLVMSMGAYGVLMFIWGDKQNTLFIFSGLSALGLFLYRPKLPELEALNEALYSKSPANN
ncbi:MAG: hypothetical protein NTY69_04620 [Methylococcales bacterium]|nr:hypothetical protein [Methylococcales bacterium]